MAWIKVVSKQVYLSKWRDIQNAEYMRRISNEDLQSFNPEKQLKEMEKQNEPIEKQKFDIRDIEKIPFVSITRKGK